MPTEKNPQPAPPIPFEEGLAQLETIVQELEQSDLSLERALELFEKGMKLSENCRRQLEEAENKLELLLKKADGKVTAEPYRPNEEEPTP